MEKAIELSPKDLTYRAELAVVNIRVGRNEEALKVLQDALAIDSKYAEAYRLMGIAGRPPSAAFCICARCSSVILNPERGRTD